jgi:intraflagellar transport protein 140
LESIGDVEKAIDHYERSETGRVEIPRMLFSLGKMENLEDYVHKSSDSILLKWWAAYLESVDRLDKAKRYYKKAGDNLSLVRICCFQGDFSTAAEIVSEAGDRASAYHFARQLEARGQFMEAINFYADAGCYNHSIRLTRAYKLDTELMRFALRATPSLMIECAAHFEEKGELEKAVQLYHKGGDLPRALDLCFRAGEMQKEVARGGSKAAQAAANSNGVFDMMNTIVQDLGVDTSPQTLARCAEFLVSHKQFEKAIELYVMAKRYNQAIEMCIECKVVINDEMVDQLTPPDTLDSAERKEILKDLARALKKQGSFILASKK